jgi:hypothetical protein
MATLPPKPTPAGRSFLWSLMTGLTGGAILLTPEGKGLMAQLNQAAMQHKEHFLSELHPTELRVLKGNVQKLLRAGGVETLNLWKHI